MTAFPLRRTALALLAAATLTTSACAMMLSTIGMGKKPPAESEFGLGPRASASGAWRATIEPAAPLRVGKLQSVKVRFVDRDSTPLSAATVSIDGGMPQHGHGLPTKPRVQATSEPGVYAVDGLRFNMGGWWEVRFKVARSAGADSVTFNIRL